MKIFRKHIVLGFMLSLVLLYSTPIKSLHNCSNLNHGNNELAFEQQHEDCPICDLQYYPFIPAGIQDIKPAPQYFTEFHTSYSGTHCHVYCNCYLNKGPPSLA